MNSRLRNLLLSASCVAFLGINLLADEGDDPRQKVRDHHAETAHLLEQFQERHGTDSIALIRSHWPRDIPLSVRFRLFKEYSNHDYRIQFLDCHGEILAWWHMHGLMRTGQRPTEGWEAWDGTSSVPTQCIDENGEATVGVRLSPARGTEVLWLSLNVQLVDSVDDILTPVVDDRFTEHLASGITISKPRATPSRDGKAMLSIRLPDDLPEDITVAFNVEFLVDDEVVATALWSPSYRYRWRRHVESNIFHGKRDSNWLFRINADTDLTELNERIGDRPVKARITSNPELALRDFDSDKYWYGSFEIDVDWHPWDEKGDTE